MSRKLYLVEVAHTSEYPDPIAFSEGTALTVGERYEGAENWHDWFFCSTQVHEGGWVPLQVIDITSEGRAYAREDYTARELDVQKGERLTGLKELNGWVWCVRDGSPDTGWVPRENLTEIV